MSLNDLIIIKKMFNNNQLRNNNNSNSLLVFMLTVASCMMMMTMGLTTASSSCSGGVSNSTIITTTASVVQSHWEVLDMEIIELRHHQNRLSKTLSILKVNSTRNADIISMRTKQIEKITKAISQLTQESLFLKDTTGRDISNNGQIFEYNDGTRGKSCLEYRNNPIHRYQYNGEGSGLYNIEPTVGLVMTVYCDMTTDGGGWTLISGIRNDYEGIHFHTFEDSTAIASSDVTSFHIKTSALLSLSTQIRVAHDVSTSPTTTFYQSSWPYSAYCTITQAFRNAIQITPTNNNGDIPTSCTVLSGSFSAVPTHFTYGRTGNDHSTGFRMGIPHPDQPGGVAHFLEAKSYATYSFNGAPEGGYGVDRGVLCTFAVGEYARNGAVFLR